MQARDHLSRYLLWALLLLALGLRLYRIDAPLTDHHYWRQVDTAAMARNFAQESADILHPMLDWQGPRGYAEVEFQLYPWLVAVLYRIVGVHEAWGRLVSVAFSIASLWLIYDLARRALGGRAAPGALAMAAAAPLAVFFGRSFQPESAMACFSLLAIYGAWRYSEPGRARWLWIAAVATALAILLKLTSLYLGLPLLALALRRDGARFLLRPRWWAFALIALVPAALWYPWAHALGKQSGAGFSILTTSGTHELFPLSLYRTAHFWLTLGRRWSVDCLALAGAPLALLGAWGLRRARIGWLWAWLGAFLCYQFGAALGHVTHDYYSLPLVYPLALCYGAGWTRISTRLSPRLHAGACLASAALLAAISMAWMHRTDDPWYGELYALRPECKELARVAPPRALLAVNDDLEHIPEPFYFSHHKGWHETNFFEWQADLSDWIETTRAEGASVYAAFLEAEGNNPLYFLYAHPTGRYVYRRYPLLLTDTKLVVADLTRPRSRGRRADFLPAEAAVAWRSGTHTLFLPQPWLALRIQDKPQYVAFDLFDATEARSDAELMHLLAPDSEYGLAFERDGIVVLQRGHSTEYNAAVRRSLLGAERYEVGRLPCYTGRPVFDIESPLLYGWQATTASDEFQDLGVLRRHELPPGRYTATYFVRCASPGDADVVAAIVLQTQPDRQLLSGGSFTGREFDSATEYARLSYSFDYAGGASPEVVLQFHDRADLLLHSLLFYPALPQLPDRFHWPARFLSVVDGHGRDSHGRLLGVGQGRTEGRLFWQLLRLPPGRYHVTLDLQADGPPPGVLARLRVHHEGATLADAPLQMAGAAVFDATTTGSYTLELWDYGMAPLRVAGFTLTREP